MAEHIDVLLSNLKDIQNGINQSLKEAVLVMSNDAKALAERTIKEEGFGAKYSNKEFPAVYFYGRELNAKGSSYLDSILDDPESDGMTNWKQFRNAQGLQTDHVDLTYSARMWKGIRPSEVMEEGNVFYTELHHNDSEGQKKMNWNFERYGDFIGKSLEGKEEVLQEVAMEVLRNRLDQYFK